MSAPGSFANLDPSVPPFCHGLCVCVGGGGGRYVEGVCICVCGGGWVCEVFLSGNGWGGWGVCFI